MAMAYCVTCHSHREVKDARYDTARNGVRYVKGVCPVCGRKIARLLGKKRADDKNGDQP